MKAGTIRLLFLWTVAAFARVRCRFMARVIGSVCAFALLTRRSVFEGGRRTSERVLHEGWVDERCSRGNGGHGEHTLQVILFIHYLSIYYLPVHRRRMPCARLVAALVAQLGSRQANLELKWMRQHPHQDIADMLRRRTLGEPLQYILGRWYPPSFSGRLTAFDRHSALWPSLSPRPPTGSHPSSRDRALGHPSRRPHRTHDDRVLSKVLDRLGHWLRMYSPSLGSPPSSWVLRYPGC